MCDVHHREDDLRHAFPNIGLVRLRCPQFPNRSAQDTDGWWRYVVSSWSKLDEEYVAKRFLLCTSKYLLRSFQCFLNIQSFSHQNSVEFLFETQQFDVCLRFRHEGSNLFVNHFLRQSLSFLSERHSRSETSIRHIDSLTVSLSHLPLVEPRWASLMDADPAHWRRPFAAVVVLLAPSVAAEDHSNRPIACFYRRVVHDWPLRTDYHYPVVPSLAVGRAVGAWMLAWETRQPSGAWIASLQPCLAVALGPHSSWYGVSAWGHLVGAVALD